MKFLRYFCLTKKIVKTRLILCLRKKSQSEIHPFPPTSVKLEIYNNCTINFELDFLKSDQLARLSLHELERKQIKILLLSGADTTSQNYKLQISLSNYYRCRYCYSTEYSFVEWKTSSMLICRWNHAIKSLESRRNKSPSIVFRRNTTAGETNVGPSTFGNSLYKIVPIAES